MNDTFENSTTFRETGRYLWCYNVSYNIFCENIELQKHLIFVFLRQEWNINIENIKEKKIFSKFTFYFNFFLWH